MVFFIAVLYHKNYKINNQWLMYIDYDINSKLSEWVKTSKVIAY